MDAGAQSRVVAANLDLLEALLPVERGPHGRLGVAQHGHDAVSEALDHLAAVILDRRLDRLADVAQELERELVTRLERPGRVVRYVGEQDRQVLVAVAAPLYL